MQIKKIINHNWNRVQNSPFIKSVLTLSAGIVIAQAVSLIATPIISRLYEPDILGDLSIISSNLVLLKVLVCLGLMPAIMIPNDDSESRRLCRLISLIVIVLSFVVLITLLCVSPFWRLFEVSIPYSLACLFLWVNIVLNCISEVCYAYTNRLKKYNVLFWNPSIGTISNAVICIGLGLMHVGLWGYIFGLLASSSLVLIHMLKHSNPFHKENENWKEYLYLLKKYKDFSLVLLPSNFVGTTAQQVPIQMLSRYWGSFTLGSYSMCLSILGLPTKFLAAPVNRVFYREATERFNKGQNIGEFTFKILEANVKLAIIPIVVLIVFGAPLFSFVLGEKWSEAGSYASVLGVYQALAFCNSSLSGKFIVINKKKTILFLNIVSLVLFSSLFYICHLLGFSPLKVITTYAVVAALFEMSDTLIFFIQAKVSIVRYIKFLTLHIVAPVVIATFLRIVVF